MKFLAGMDALALKIIAIIAMTIDHIGFIFFPDYIILRIIGRLAFPIMAFLAAEGCRKTRDIKRYLSRLFLFALISIFPFALVFHYPGNVLFTIFVGVAGIYLSERAKSPAKSALIFSAVSLLAIPCDWGIFGAWMIYGFYKANRSKIKSFLYLCAVMLAGFAVLWRLGELRDYLFQIGILLSLPVIWLYNGKRGCLGGAVKYLFYIYYPLHLLVLWVIWRLTEAL